MSLLSGGFSLDSSDYDYDEIDETEDGALATEEEELLDDEIVSSPEEQTEGDDTVEDDEIELDVNGQQHKFKPKQIEEALAMYLNKDESNNDPDYGLYKQVKPMMDKVRNSDILKQFMSYSAQGYSDEEIINGIFYLRNPQIQQALNGMTKGSVQPNAEPEEPPVFDTAEEETQYYVQQSLNKALAPITNQLQSLLAKQTQAETSLNMANLHKENDTLLNNAMKKHGFVIETDDDRELLREVLWGLYPNEKLMEKKLTQDQAELLIQTTLARKARRGAGKEAQKAKALAMQQNLPKLFNGTGKKNGSEKAKNINDMNYKQAIDNFFNN